MPDALPPINASMRDHAGRVVRRTLEGAERGDAAAERAVLRYAAAQDLEAVLRRLVKRADAVCPTLEEIKLNRGLFSSDAVALRFEIEAVDKVLAQAAGRAVVVEMESRKEPEDAA